MSGVGSGIAAPSPSRLTQPLVQPGPKNLQTTHRPLGQIALKVLFAVFCILAIVGRATGQHTMWKAAFPAPTVVAMVLICAIWCSPGVRCPKYGTGVLLGLLLTLGGDIFIVEPPDLELFFLAFLFSMAGMFSFTFAFWAPSVPTSRLADANVDTSRSASPASAAGVPLNMFRLVPVLALAGAVVAAWRTVGWRHTPLVVPVGIYLGTVGLMLWRAAARIGYRVPVPSPKVSAMLKRSMSKRMQEWEHVEVQWAGLLGAFCLALGQLLVGYNRLWVADRYEVIEYASAILHWLAVFCITSSVPTVDPPLPSLRDKSLVPEPYDAGHPISVLIILPDRDFDVTEVAVPWFLLHRRGHDVVFATEHGTVPQCDPYLLTGVVLGQLGAEPLAKQMYFEMQNDPAFLNPITWQSIEPEEYGGLILPGGHASGMRQYLGSKVVQYKVAQFWQLDRPIGAICHGVLVLARTILPETGKSVLNGMHATCLPEFMEQTAYFSTCCCRGRYYRTYKRTVQDEVVEALGRRGSFFRGPITFTRGTPWDNSHAYVVEHHHLITSRWPGDAFLFARRFIARLEEVPRLY